MAYTNSSLISYTRISPNRNSPRNQPISKITIHHCAGVLSVEQFGNIVAPTSRQMSANYCIGNDGRIGLFCPESDRSWCSSSAWNDNRAITIEVSNSAYGDASGWPVSDAAYASLIKLCVDICKRNGIKKLEFTGDTSGSLTYHYMLASTGCPGPWIKAHTQDICNKVNAQLGGTATPVNSSTTTTISSGKFAVGDLVKINTGARYYNGGAIPAWVLSDQWYVSSIKGDRVVLGNNKAKNQNIQSPIKASSLTLVTAANPAPAVKELYKIKLEVGKPIYKEIGKAATDKIKMTTTYTIVEEKTVGNIVYGKLKSGVGWVEVKKLERTYDINNKDDVKALQKALNAKGYNCGTVDGVIGSKTTTAMFSALCKMLLG